MQTATQSPVVKAIKTFVSCKCIKGASFVGVKGYINQKGEESNYTVLVGFTYFETMKNDLEKLKSFDITKVTGFSPELVKEAYAEMVLSLEKRLADEATKEALAAQNDATINRSEAQTNAYENLAKGLKTQDGILYLYGLLQRKTKVKAIDYGPDTRKPKTIAKATIEKIAELRAANFRLFKLGGLETLNIKGLSI